jgi:hypothetical protein
MQLSALAILLLPLALAAPAAEAPPAALAKRLLPYNGPQMMLKLYWSTLYDRGKIS